MDFASQNLTAGQLNAIVKKLGGEDGAMRFLRGELVVAVPTPLEFPVWKTVKLGTGLKTADEFREALSDGGYSISDWADNILDQLTFTVSETEISVDLVNVSVSDLCFKEGSYLRKIIERALSLGLELCPAEVGLALRLQYADQPKGDWLVIGMEPTNPDDYLRVFYIGYDDERWLSDSYGSPDDFWYADSRFVFVKPRSK